MKKIFAILALAVSCSVWAGPFEDGQDAYIKQDYARAVELYKVAAAQGNIMAQNNLGEMYLDGVGVAQDYTEALRLLNMSAV